MMRHWFYVYQDGICVAKGVCYSREMAEQKARLYAAICTIDGPVEFKFRKVFSRKG